MTKEEQIDWLCRLRSEIYVYMPKEWLIPMNNALDVAISALSENRWIPVSERLPKAFETVLRTRVENGWNGTTYTMVDTGCICPIDHNIVAWMPLPKYTSPVSVRPYPEKEE